MSDNVNLIVSDDETINDPQWKTHPINVFENSIMKKEDMKGLSRSTKRFYKKQNKLIEDLKEADNYECEQNDEKILLTDSITDHCHRRKRSQIVFCTNPTDEFIAKSVFVVNFVLFWAKLAASIKTGSMSIISSLIDSATDLLSGTLMWWTARGMKKFNPYLYPEGRRRLEPVSIIILAVFMSVASIQVIRESVTIIVEMATIGRAGPTTDNISIAIIICTILLKIVILIICKIYGRSETSAALFQDSRNDILSNSVALLCSTFSNRLNVKELKYLDPSGAILIASYIIYSWIQTGFDNVKALTGHTANSRFLQKMTFISLNHHPDIKYIDTVRAFHFGTNFLVEIDIVLDETMPLKMAHDIGESLQKRVECIEEVERCFVHLDYEFSHDPRIEHKLV